MASNGSGAFAKARREWARQISKGVAVRSAVPRYANVPGKAADRGIEGVTETAMGDKGPDWDRLFPRRRIGAPRLARRDGDGVRVDRRMMGRFTRQRAAVQGEVG